MSKEIKKQAKRIIDNFVKELVRVKTKEVRVEREEDRRKEGGGGGDKEFRDIFLKNAPEVEKGRVKAERGKWEK